MVVFDKFDKLFISTTDTVLGIGGKVEDDVKNLIYEIKGRDKNKKLIILVASIQQARNFSQWNEEAESLAKQYWPGATTLVVNDQGFRMPNQARLLAFLEKNGPIYMSSCNLSNTPVCQSIKEAKKVFPKIKRFYNFGKMTQKPSQIISVETKEILRK
nr:Sua5/YciO/YrdC/YwlC family protein [Mycoplasma phocoeninasale]